MNPDSDLLRLYVEQRSESAFAELVGRHLKMVHACALRRVGCDTHLADDVTQLVFNDLARKARRLGGRPTLSGWLYVSTQLASAGIVRRERRRKSRESEASATENTPRPSGDSHAIDWALVRPVLDVLILDLKPTDRDAVVLRFFEQRSFSEIGAVLQTTEDAARKRVERAVEKLRTQLERRGLNSTPDALEFALAQPTEAQPHEAQQSGRVAAIAATEFATTGVATTFLLSLIRFLTSETAASGGALLGIVLIIAHQINENSRLSAEIAHLNVSVEASRELKNENRRLKDVVEQSADMTRRQSIAYGGRVESTTSGRGKFSVPLNLVVTSEGTLSWEQEHVTLSEFLDKLVAYEAQHPGPDAHVIVHGEAGSTFSSTAYVVEQASKAGIQDIVLDSQSRPTSSDTWTFTSQSPTNDERDIRPPSLPDPPAKP